MLVLSLTLVVTNRRQYRLWEYLAMFLCCALYGATILLNGRAHFLNEIMVLLYMICSYFMLTYCGPRMSEEQAEKELRVLAWIVVGISFLFAVVNLGWYFLHYLRPEILPKSSYFSGINNNQLGGVYNPNTGGVHNYVSILLSAMLFAGACRGKKIFLVLNALLQFACFSLVQSRGAWIAFLAFLILYFLFILKKEGLSLPKQLLLKVGSLVICILLLTNGSQLTREALSQAVLQLEKKETTVQIRHSTHCPYEMVILELEDPPEAILSDRDYTRGGHTDMTTGRSGLWKVGLKAWSEHPVLGVGYRSIDGALKEGLSDFDYHNSGSGGLHNVYVTVLVSGGILGFLPFAAVIVFLLLRVLKLYLDPKASVCAKLTATMIPAWLVGELVESRIAMSFTNLSVFFWVTAGYVIFYTRKRDNK